jgi:hypothetical protein
VPSIARRPVVTPTPHRPTRRDRGLAPAAIAGLLAIAVAGTSRAQEPETVPPLDFAFATQLGSGVYTAGGRTVQIYRIPISWELRSAENRAFGVELTFPLTLGFFDFRTSDILDGDLPDDIGTVSLVPGVEFEIPIAREWWLMPFAEAGYATDLESGGSALTYAGGVKSLALFRRPTHLYRLWNVLKYVGFTETDAWASQGYVEFDTGIELRQGLGFTMKGQEADLGWFVVDYFYAQGLTFNDLQGGEITIHDQIEIGVTFGTECTIKIWSLPVPRFGISYRFGDDVSAVRLVLGAPF